MATYEEQPLFLRNDKSVKVALAVTAAAAGIVVISALQHTSRPAPMADLVLR